MSIGMEPWYLRVSKENEVGIKLHGSNYFKDLQSLGM